MSRPEDAGTDALLRRAAELAIRAREGLRTGPVAPAVGVGEMVRRLRTPLPEQGEADT